MSDELQRALGRVEGKQDATLAKLDHLEEALGDHKNEDQKNFSSIRKLVFDLKDELKAEIAAIQQDTNRAKGAGWVVLGLLGTLATILGGAVIAALGGHIKIG